MTIESSVAVEGVWYGGCMRDTVRYPAKNQQYSPVKARWRPAKKRNRKRPCFFFFHAVTGTETAVQRLSSRSRNATLGAQAGRSKLLVKCALEAAVPR